MRSLILGTLGIVALVSASQPVGAWMRAGRFGDAWGGGGSWHAEGWRGGTASGGGGSWSAENWRGTASGGDG
ncbi:MAG TPA: hypothetical protein VFY87_19275, partial [Geminicoccaceae bacterium]|nr:hypothetical protein [Geminicoccaceae bacterium]